MQDANLSFALLRECLLTQSFDALTAVATSLSGQYWAAGSRRGEVRLWRGEGQIFHLFWQAHTDVVITLAFSPDERTLASGSFDGSVKLWDAESGALLWSGWHTRGTHCSCLAISPDGSLLASGGHDATVRLRDAKLGTLLEEVPHPISVISLDWSADGCRLASGDIAGTIRLWERQPTGPTRCVHALKVSPDGGRLASCGDDGAIVLWDLEAGKPLRTLRRDRPYERLNITGIRGLSETQKASLRALGAFEETSRDE